MQNEEIVENIEDLEAEENDENTNNGEKGLVYEVRVTINRSGNVTGLFSQNFGPLQSSYRGRADLHELTPHLEKVLSDKVEEFKRNNLTVPLSTNVPKNFNPRREQYVSVKLDIPQRERIFSKNGSL